MSHMSVETFTAGYLTSHDSDLAQRHMDRGEFSQAAWVLRSALRTNPADARVLLLLAACCQELGQPRAAADALHRARNGGRPQAVAATEPLAEATPGSRGIFIGGTGRSGTSLLRRVLNSHPAMAAAPGEAKCIHDPAFRMAPYWFHAQPLEARPRALEQLKTLWRERFFCYVQPRTSMATEDPRRGLCLWLEPQVLEAELPRLDVMLEADTLHALELAWGDLFAALLGARAREEGAPCWVEKTPANAAHCRFLQAWLPASCMVNIVRDGRDVACSMQNVSWGQKDLAKALDWWAEKLVEGLGSLQTLPAHWSLTIRYEDLVGDGGATLARVAAFLGLAPEFGLEMFPTSVGRWKQSMPLSVQRRAHARYAGLLSHFGYEVGCVANDVPEPAMEADSRPATPGNFEMKLRRDGVRYVQDLLRPLGEKLANVRMCDFAEGNGQGFMLRHDVDDRIEASLQMSELESRNGLRATYFLLPPSPMFAPENYYGRIEGNRVVRNPKLAEYAKFFQDLGHDVGLHNNIAELALLLDRSLPEVLAEEVEFFARHGVRLVGSAGHGSSFFHELGFVSYEIFREARVKPGCERGREVGVNGRTIRLHSLSLADYNMDFEAYSLSSDLYLADSKGRWSGSLISRSPHPDLDELPLGPGYLRAFGRAVCQAANQATSIQVLIHPQHWLIG